MAEDADVNVDPANVTLEKRGKDKTWREVVAVAANNGKSFYDPKYVALLAKIATDITVSKPNDKNEINCIT